jgi:hypothetical protein
MTGFNTLPKVYSTDFILQSWNHLIGLKLLLTITIHNE